jgi:hypothetical protein
MPYERLQHVWLLDSSPLIGRESLRDPLLRNPVNQCQQQKNKRYSMTKATI